ncbi:alpha-ketoglutarate-dependent dioxygenase AlkB [Nakamurella antarctica]|uniref:Alpha-ketoglutarate-dependent dioxygenase AlkB n=1 Tax=Nakamurella antarctica TaxID=1902245 RepID=A0A3G8ZPQ6_9ACTN|nr:alpha-ketoglutarate-dependent dioxygenase AlkB [Nakamurella antarctica]AZI59128.1 alpha-ketoglutarate-dependent dioxygenase AlkB [Nakamurella antarctica]
MAAPSQASLFDFDDVPTVRPLAGVIRRTELAGGAWVDIRPGWVGGSDALFEELALAVPWHGERRQMYDREVAVPRLLCFYDESASLPNPALVAAKAMLDDYYREELGEPFSTAGMCLYRDGNDSVAWHGDTIGRSKTEDTMVAILSLGAPRSLLLRQRPIDGTITAPPVKYGLGHGDLIVMGGSCLRTWEHAIPKTSRPVGPRISVQFRPRGVR